MRESVDQELEAALDAVEQEFAATKEAEEQHFMEAFSPARVTAAKIAELKAKYSALKISGVDDKKGYELVRAARLEVKEYRVSVEKVRKQLKEDSLAYGRKVDAEAKRITSMLLEIEKPLDEQETAIDEEIARIKAEKQREVEARLEKRIRALQAVGAPFQISELVMMTEGAFLALLNASTEAWNAKEAARLDMEAKAKAYEEQQAREAAEKEAAAKAERDRLAKEEADRLAAVRAQQAQEAERLAKQAAELRAEREAIEAEKAKAGREAMERKIREEAEAKAKADAEQKAVAERTRQEHEAKAAAERAAANEAAKPDAEKLSAFAAKVAAMETPSLATPAGRAAENEIHAALIRFAEFIKAKAASLTK